jgi:hypothetical protein
VGGLDPAKLLVILVLALVILGPERLPKAARQIGSLWRDFNLFRERLEQEVRSAIPDVNIPAIPVIPKSGLTGYLTGMMRDADKAGGTATLDPLADEPDYAGASGEPPEVAWQPSGGGSLLAPSGNPAPVTVPNGVPASWGSTGAELPGYASGSLLSPVPVSQPEAILGAEARLDLDDPSWN